MEALLSVSKLICYEANSERNKLTGVPRTPLSEVWIDHNSCKCNATKGSSNLIVFIPLEERLIRCIIVMESMILLVPLYIFLQILVSKEIVVSILEV